jgi:8-oxo-dGTP diphosphatase
MEERLPNHEFLASITTVPVVAGVLIADGDRFLVLQHKTPDALGLWGWPAGFVENGGDLEATAIREAKEETNLDVRLVRPLRIYHSHARDVVKHLYAAEIVGGDLRVDDVEIVDARWLTEAEIRELDAVGRLRAEWVLDGVEAYGIG